MQSTQRKMLRLIIQTRRRYKKIVKRKDETNEEKDTNDLGSTGDESGDGQSSNTLKDHLSFENDTEEEIDTTEIEEEDWIEYIKKKHKRCKRKDGKFEDFMLEQDSQKMKWRLALLRIASSPSQEKDGKMTSTNSSNLLRTRQKTLLKAAAKSTKHGSTQQKTAEDGIYSKKNTQ